MSRALWTGTLSFGLISIPIKLYKATRENGPQFHLLHKTDGSPVRMEYVCQADGRTIPSDELVKGFEYEPGKHIVLTKEDFLTAAVERSKTLDLLDFVAKEELDGRLFETPYLLTPDKGGERAYALLREALRQSDKVALAKLVLRDAQHLVAIGPVQEALVLTLLRFAEELVPLSEQVFPSQNEVQQHELEMARTLVESLARPFDLAQYEDDYRNNLIRLIEAKRQGQGQGPALDQEGPDQKQASVISLMERLRQSLEAGRPPLEASHEPPEASHDKGTEEANPVQKHPHAAKNAQVA